jgi:hypothetical protein
MWIRHSNPGIEAIARLYTALVSGAEFWVLSKIVSLSCEQSVFGVPVADLYDGVTGVRKQPLQLQNRFLSK